METSKETNERPEEMNVRPKERHGCVTAWLILMIIANSIVAVGYLFGGEFVAKNFPGGISNTVLVVLGILGVVNVVSAVMLFNWKKIGFWGFTISAIITLIINLYIGVGIIQSVWGLAGIAILYVILQIKKDDVDTWTNLD